MRAENGWGRITSPNAPSTHGREAKELYMKRTTEESFLMWVLIIGASVFLALLSAHVLAADARFCGVVYRSAKTHEVLRNDTIKDHFKAEVPCILPCDATFEIDHIYPLSRGGCDSIINMQWLSPEIKRCAKSTGRRCKDQYELKLYGQKPYITVYK